MKQIDSITIGELATMAEAVGSGFVKAVVDTKRHLVVVDADFHADEEQYLLERGSDHADLWGINLMVDNYGTDDFIEFDSMINIRPRTNRSRFIANPGVRDDITALIAAVVHD